MEKQLRLLKASSIQTPLGPMTAIADEEKLYVLEFADNPKREETLKKLRQLTSAPIVKGITAPLESIAKELEAYFCGVLQHFKTPYSFLGTPFQQQVWTTLQLIPYGDTWSYRTQAETMSFPSAYRAIANANSKNCLSIVIPCHRVIRHNGSYGGYGGGLHRKKWLIDYEKKERLLLDTSNFDKTLEDA